MTFIKGHSI